MDFLLDKKIIDLNIPILGISIKIIDHMKMYFDYNYKKWNCQLFFVIYRKIRQFLFHYFILTPITPPNIPKVVPTSIIIILCIFKLNFQFKILEII